MEKVLPSGRCNKAVRIWANYRAYCAGLCAGKRATNKSEEAIKFKGVRKRQEVLHASISNPEIAFNRWREKMLLPFFSVNPSTDIHEMNSLEKRLDGVFKFIFSIYSDRVFFVMFFLRNICKK